MLTRLTRQEYDLAMDAINAAVEKADTYDYPECVHWSVESTDVRQGALFYAEGTADVRYYGGSNGSYYEEPYDAEAVFDHIEIEVANIEDDYNNYEIENI